MDSRKNFKEYSHNEEVMNIITHAIGIPLSFIAFYLLFRVANNEDEKYITFSIYCLSMLATYASSTAYHAAFKSRIKLKNRLHLFDHAAIYLFIAGTYTPISMLFLGDSTKFWILRGVWSFALIGIAIKVFFIGRYSVLSSIMYLLMGWMIIFAIQDLVDNTPRESLYYLLFGGISYSVGVVFYLLKNLKYSHAIWHLFVLGGSILHFLSIYLFMINK